MLKNIEQTERKARLKEIAKDCICLFVAFLIIGIVAVGMDLVIATYILIFAFSAAVVAVLMGFADMIISIWRR